MKKNALAQYFLWSSGALLVISAVAKIISCLAQAPLLNQTDPILGFSIRSVLFTVGLLELGVSAFCFFGNRIALRTGALAALAGSIAIYRLGMVWIGYHRPCRCMGNLTDLLGISESTADVIMKSILGYFLIGSMAVMAWLWWDRMRKVSAGASSKH